MSFLFWTVGYLSIGAIAGLLDAERYHQNSSDGFRSPGDYVFSACALAIMWPIVLIVAAKDRE